MVCFSAIPVFIPLILIQNPWLGDIRRGFVAWWSSLFSHNMATAHVFVSEWSQLFEQYAPRIPASVVAATFKVSCIFWQIFTTAHFVFSPARHCLRKKMTLYHGQSTAPRCDSPYSIAKSKIPIKFRAYVLGSCTDFPPIKRLTLPKKTFCRFRLSDNLKEM